MIEPVNLKILQSLHHRAMQNDVRYRLGAKVKLDTPIDRVRVVDCSGWSRYLMYWATDKKVVMPDGSWIQRDWCKGFFKRVPYRSVHDNPNELHLAFLDPKGGKAGHVWYAREGHTFESRGGVGPDERPWNTPFLKAEVDYTFLIPHIWK